MSFVRPETSFFRPETVDRNLWHMILDPYVLSDVRGMTMLPTTFNHGDGNMLLSTRQRIAASLTRLRCVCRLFCSLYSRNIWLWTRVMPVNPDSKLNQQRCVKLEALLASKDLVAFEKCMVAHQQKTLAGWAISFRNKVLDHIRYNEGIAKSASRSKQKMEDEISERRHWIAKDELKIRRAEESIQDWKDVLARLPPKRTVVRKKAKLNDDDAADEDE